MIFTTNAAGHLSHVSREWITLTGQDATNAVDNGWLACIHEQDREIVQSVFTKAAMTASEFSVRFRMCFVDGTIRWVGAGGVPSFGPPDYTFLGYLGSMTELAPNASDVMHAYGSIGRFLPPPTHPATTTLDHLDAIADHLIIAHSLIEEDGAKSALPALRQALFEVGVALARKSEQPSKPN